MNSRGIYEATVMAMGSRLARMGRLLLAGVELGLALLGLFAIWILRDISAGVQSGAYNQEAASGFTIGFLTVWALSFGILALILGIHAAIWLVQTLGGDAPGSLTDPLPRFVGELLGAAILTVIGFGLRPSSGGFELLLAASAVLGFWAIGHWAVATAGTVSRVVTPRLSSTSGDDAGEAGSE